MRFKFDLIQNGCLCLNRSLKVRFSQYLLSDYLHTLFYDVLNWLKIVFFFPLNQKELDQINAPNQDSKNLSREFIF